MDLAASCSVFFLKDTLYKLNSNGSWIRTRYYVSKRITFLNLAIEKNMLGSISKKKYSPED